MKELAQMKSTGIIRKVDDLGRIVLPIELRRTLDIAERDELEIYMENDQIILRKYEPSCVFCASDRRLVYYSGKSWGASFLPMNRSHSSALVPSNSASNVLASNSPITI